MIPDHDRAEFDADELTTRSLTQLPSTYLLLSTRPQRSAPKSPVITRVTFAWTTASLSVTVYMHHNNTPQCQFLALAFGSSTPDLPLSMSTYRSATELGRELLSGSPTDSYR